MKINRITIFLLSFIISLFCSISLPGQEAARASSSTSQLTEPREATTNEIQPPEMVMDILGVRPGMIIGEVGDGYGRLTVHLASLGWDVTGIDLSEQGLAVMQTNAEKAGLKVRTIKTSYQDFNFGREQWDLVAMILSWAPVEEPGFLALAPGALRELFRDFEILIYEEVDAYGDWGGPPTPHVRMVARKSV